MIDYLKYNDLEEDYNLPSAQQAKNKHRLYEELKEQVTLLTNNQVFQDFTSLLAGDSYGGELTAGGCVALSCLEEELTKRLEAVGFFTNG